MQDPQRLMGGGISGPRYSHNSFHNNLDTKILNLYLILATGNHSFYFNSSILIDFHHHSNTPGIVHVRAHLLSFEIGASSSILDET